MESNPPHQRNPTLWLVVALPAAAVIASFVSLALAVRSGDKPLPAFYHAEGASQDADQARVDAAARAGVSVTLSRDAASGICVATVTGASPARLRVAFTHDSDPGADLQLDLIRDGDAWRARCPAVPNAAHWWVEITDSAGAWMLRDRIRGGLARSLQIGTGRRS